MAVSSVPQTETPPQSEAPKKTHHGGGGHAKMDDPNDPSSPNYQPPYDTEGKGQETVGRLGSLEQGTTNKA